MRLIEYLNIDLYKDYMLNSVHNDEPVSFRFISIKLKHLIMTLMNIQFDAIEKFFSNLSSSSIKYLSFYAANLSFINGQRWKCILSNYFHRLKTFRFYITYRCILKSFSTTIKQTLQVFQTDDWLEHRWYFMFDYCPIREQLNFYSYPFNDKCYVTELNIFQSKYDDESVDNSTTSINDKINELCMTLANNNTNINIEQLKNGFGKIRSKDYRNFR
ncbi:unnamed protein product [Didymodactylos carnosus]|uniref:Uncharacterized protein n=1 Tax=Didymodactylos carnosus TaxID=1234261 RepID=A0A815PV09_9BILA|nr:unnamed protein product [Didymodactylos carnosus]CAF4326716.1 unnamed protein product [Didymodactylos carnosus]